MTVEPLDQFIAALAAHVAHARVLPRDQAERLVADLVARARAEYTAAGAAEGDEFAGFLRWLSESNRGHVWRERTMRETTAAMPAIIVVDDEREILLLLRRVMRDLIGDYDIIVAQSATEALAHLAVHSVPLLLIDYHMPDINGLELAQAVRAASPTTVMLMITGDPSPDLPSRAYAAGIAHFLTKPFPLSDLRQIVQAALEGQE
jgi:CheY-like chemotaxis protein